MASLDRHLIKQDRDLAATFFFGGGGGFVILCFSKFKSQSQGLATVSALTSCLHQGHHQITHSDNCATQHY